MFALSEPEFREAISTLQGLIRIDTTNPPGNERPAAEYLAGLLKEDGFNPLLTGPDEAEANQRTSLVTRLPGTGEARPLLLASHLDVVPADPAQWKHPPFSGVEDEGCLWGRGAVDMKTMTVLGLTVLRLLKRRGIRLKRDLIFAATADEEAGGQHGAGWLVKHRPDLIDCEYVINEVGGFTLHLRGRRFYPVQVAEKGVAWLRATVRGQPGHGSLPTPESAVTRMGAAVGKLAKARLPIHPTGPARELLQGMAGPLGAAARALLPQLLNPAIGHGLLPVIVPPERRPSMQALICNTANPTVVRAGKKTNVIPGEASFEIDGRLLPGQTPEDLIREIRNVIGPEIELELIGHLEPTVTSPDTPLFDTIRETMRSHDPEGHVIPSLIPGFTDSHHYSRHPSRPTCYGFYPLKLPESLNFSELFHGHNERVPVEAVRFGIQVLGDVIMRFAG